MKGAMKKSIPIMKNSPFVTKGEDSQDINSTENKSLSCICHYLMLENKEVSTNCKYYDKTAKLINLCQSLLI